MQTFWLPASEGRQLRRGDHHRPPLSSGVARILGFDFPMKSDCSHLPVKIKKGQGGRTIIGSKHNKNSKGNKQFVPNLKPTDLHGDCNKSALCFVKTKVRNRISPAMPDCLNEQRSGRVGTFLIIEWLEGSLGDKLIEAPEDLSIFLPHASSEESAFINFLEFLFSTVLFCGKERP